MSKTIKLHPEKTVCRDLWAYPVVDITRPRIRTCCKRLGEIVPEKTFQHLRSNVFLNLPQTMEERKMMLNGERPEGCKLCWDLEDRELPSFRLGRDDFQFHFNNINGDKVPPEQFRSFDVLLQDSENLLYSDKPNKIDISLGTYCDQKCIYCNSDYSTQWEAEDKKYGETLLVDPEFPTKVNYVSKNSQGIEGWYDSFSMWFDTVYENFERIALLGGEPTYSPYFIPLSTYIVERLKIFAHPNCSLSIVTNLNWSKKVFDHIKYIRSELPLHVKLIIEVSMESYGKRAEYIRSGLDWDKFLHNMHEIAELQNVDINIISTLNGLCVSSILDFYKELYHIEQKNNRYIYIVANKLVFPKWLSFEILDERYKHYIVDVINFLKNNYFGTEGWHSKKLICETLESTLKEFGTEKNTDLLQYFAKWIYFLDKRRNTKFVEIFPEFECILNENDWNNRKFSQDEIVRFRL